MSRLFAPARKRVADPDYLRFRHLAKAHGLQYRLSLDHYLEVEACPALPRLHRDQRALPRGLKTAHIDWSESAARIQHCIQTPEDVDQDGYYVE